MEFLSTRPLGRGRRPVVPVARRLWSVQSEEGRQVVLEVRPVVAEQERGRSGPETTFVESTVEDPTGSTTTGTGSLALPGAGPVKC